MFSAEHLDRNSSNNIENKPIGKPVLAHEACNSIFGVQKEYNDIDQFFDVNIRIDFNNLCFTSKLVYK